MNLSKKDMAWLDETWDKTITKLKYMATTLKDELPHHAENRGEYYNRTRISDWTGSFWPGMLWHLYLETKDEQYKKYAESVEDQLDELFVDYERLHHDVGFMWLLTSVANYRITGNDRSRQRALHAANVLAARFNPTGNFIRAWNHWGNDDNYTKAIIDCMMNIPILYWATDMEKDTRFKTIAMLHADTVAEKFIRADGSVNHMLVFDKETGEVVKAPYGQGFAEGSSWTRGQAWAIYGFAMSYIKTGKKEYLEAAQKVSHYFMTAMINRDVAPCDFRQPEDCDYLDSGANAIAACGLIEISKLVPEWDSKMYLDAALKLLKGLDGCLNTETTNDYLLDDSTGSYFENPGKNHNVPHIWSDYYYVEALGKLKGIEGIFSY